MADNSKIEWTDSTWNPITGCSVVSPGCTNCYAMRLAGTRMKNHWSRKGLTDASKAGPVWNGKVRFNDAWLDQPLRWRKPRRIFVCAHGDLFHENVPDLWITQVFAVMALAQQHTFQVLTKRPDRMRVFCEYFQASWQNRSDYLFAMDELTPGPPGSVPLISDTWPLPNVWLGVSVEDQDRADERIPDLLATPAAVRFLSCEPLLGPIWMSNGWLDLIDWVIVGGESGPGARDMSEVFANGLLNQCSYSKTAFFMKQMARKAPIPDDLMVRQWPGEK